MMSEWLTSMGAAVANHLWQSTAFGVVAWAVTLLLRKNPARVRYGVWVAASVKFVVPFSLLIGLGGMLPRPQKQVVAMPVYSAVDYVGMPFDEAPISVADPTHAAIRPRHEWGTRVMGLLPAGLAVVWGCGVVVVLVVWGGGWMRVTRTLRRARRVEDGREAEILRRVEAAGGRRRRPVTMVLSRELMEPGMFGVWRPVLIWPARLSERLDDEHIEAIVAHELMHARRRDNLTAALHMVVEAIFWFHPLVWWMERRMVEEREHACDEAVVAMGSRPGVYAESLLKAVRFCVESPLVCVAGVTGADLTARVRAIMTERAERLGWWRRVALGALGVAAIAGPLAFGVVRMIPVYGQVFKATGPLPSYEVVVIKPSQDPAQGASTDGEQTHYLMTAKMLIQFAYGIFSPPKVMDLNVVGGPDWINSDVFSIVGKMDSAEFEQEQKLGRAQRHERRQLMEQSLLADRFKLKMHVETRDEPVYALTVIKGGPKLTPAKDATGSAHVNPNPGSMGPEDLKRGLIVRRKGRGFEMTVKGMTLDTFVDALMAQQETAGRQVVNQTGLTGAYDFTLTWGPEETAASDSGEVEEPPLFTAIQQQLGLKLADGKGPAEVVVVDHIEKPVFDSADGTMPTSAPAGRVMNVGFAQTANLQSQSTAEPGAPANRAANIAATWQGTLHTGRDQRFVVKITQAGNGTLRATFYNIDAEPDGIPAISTTLNGPLLKVELPFGTYQGAVSGDGNSITGTWNQGGNPRPLNFARATPETEWTIPQPPRMAPMAADANPAFEVATVKPSRPDEPGPQFWMQGRRFSVVHTSVSDIVNFAYGVQQRQVAGAPDWFTSERYDVSAVSGGEGEPNFKQWQAMVKKLMADRLQMKFHYEKRELAVYALTVAKTGPKLTRSQSAPSAPGGKGFGPPGNFGATNATMADVADALGYVVVDRPVVDQTGLTGRFDLKLKWTPDGTATVSADAPPEFFTAIQQELGLKLEPAKAPVDVLVIDHVERPSEN